MELFHLFQVAFMTNAPAHEERPWVVLRTQFIIDPDGHTRITTVVHSKHETQERANDSCETSNTLDR
jgi:hypothetical protein